MASETYSLENLNVFVADHPETVGLIRKVGEYLTTLIGWGAKINKSRKKQYTYEIKFGTTTIKIILFYFEEAALTLSFDLSIKLISGDKEYEYVPINGLVFFLLNTGVLPQFLSMLEVIVNKEMDITNDDWKLYAKYNQIITGLFAELMPAFKRMIVDGSRTWIYLPNEDIYLTQYIKNYTTSYFGTWIRSQNQFTPQYFRLLSPLISTENTRVSANAYAYSFLSNEMQAVMNNGVIYAINPLLMGVGVSEEEYLKQIDNVLKRFEEDVTRNYKMAIFNQTNFIPSSSVKSDWSDFYKELTEGYATNLDVENACGIWRNGYNFAYLKVHETKGEKPRAVITAELQTFWKDNRVYTSNSYPFSFKQEIGSSRGITELDRKKIVDILREVHIFLNNLFVCYPQHNFLVANDPYLLYSHLYTHPRFELGLRLALPLMTGTDLKLLLKNIEDTSPPILNKIPNAIDPPLEARKKIKEYLSDLLKQPNITLNTTRFEEFYFKTKDTFEKVGIDYNLNGLMPFLRDPNAADMIIEKEKFGDGSVMRSTILFLLREGFYLEVGILLERLIAHVVSNESEADEIKYKQSVIRTFENALGLSKDQFHIYYPFNEISLGRKRILQSRGWGLAFFIPKEGDKYALVKLNACPFLNSEFRQIKNLITTKGWSCELEKPDLILITCHSGEINPLIADLKQAILTITLNEWSGFLNMYYSDKVFMKLSP